MHNRGRRVSSGALHPHCLSHAEESQPAVLSAQSEVAWKGGGVAWTTLRDSCVSVAESDSLSFGSDRPSCSFGRG